LANISKNSKTNPFLSEIATEGKNNKTILCTVLLYKKVTWKVTTNSAKKN
jgi:hypothetical protein